MNDDTLRLIANPHLLKKHNVPTKVEFSEKIGNLLEIEYNQQIDPTTIHKIEANISSIMKGYLIKQVADQLIDDCIREAVATLNLINNSN